mmetsp:Transcript_4110/g.5398  ORF Transcript_4110/g.5398 Transcript_4110/m.5398 type:complete len:319 (-) Transcript_4110:232-1188(-)|eukprot:CAMPEP_0198154182 /NCGR_PEP_ID=MMETSP1443-20131203/67639_1 /TAXON_ID=186043 /ORGANISM="Entomoneis sp., Strain CCMP2396" /LENGTH=318 /DNA_ID=CAMNT_0043820805 /DNA_START=587 /DNA_END=1543 /DNA_ORIENTATION=-
MEVEATGTSKNNNNNIDIDMDMDMDAALSSSSPRATAAAAVLQWVDYLPGQFAAIQKKSQAAAGAHGRDEHDPQEATHKTTETEMDVDGGDWPFGNNGGGASGDASSLNSLDVYGNGSGGVNKPTGGGVLNQVLIPHYLLQEQDPYLQHELATTSYSTSGQQSLSIDGSSDWCSVNPEGFANSLGELLEQRRIQLAASMQASRRTRQVLGPHIRQRAGLSNVLSQIERSSWTIREHLLSEEQQQQAAESQQQQQQQVMHEDQVPPLPPTIVRQPHTDHHSVTPSSCNSVDMTGIEVHDEDDVEGFAASVLNDPEDCLL